MGEKVVVQNLVKYYGGVEVLGGVNFRVRERELVCILGPIGCGKSTTLKIVAGLEKADDGRVYVNGESSNYARVKEKLAVVFQSPRLFYWRNVYENVLLGLELGTKHISKSEMQNKVESVLKAVGLIDQLNKYPNQLSGGQKQLVALGRALVVDPDVLLMDEPFGSLDALTRSSLQTKLLKILCETKKTVLFVTHDINEALLLSNKIIVYSDKPAKVCHDTTIDLSHPRDLADPRISALYYKILSFFKRA